MSKTKIVALGLLIGCLALPAFAQSTSNCSGQPWSGTATGGVAPFLALPAGANDQFITGNGANCIAGPAPDVDSIWCFTPASNCSATFTVTGLGGGETVAFNLYSGPCAGSPAAGTPSACRRGLPTRSNVSRRRAKSLSAGPSSASSRPSPSCTHWPRKRLPRTRISHRCRGRWRFIRHLR